MNASEILSPEEQSLALATKRAIQAAGGLERCAEETGLGTSQLSRCSMPNCRDSITERDAATIEAIGYGSAGHPHILRARARLLGYAIIKVPDASLGGTVWSQRAATLLKEGGDIVSGLGRALETNNDVEPDEARALLLDADELVTIALEIQAALRSRSEGKF
jgi:hypothetical protein